MNEAEFLLITTSLHEFCHIWAAKLLGVRVLEVALQKEGPVLPHVFIEHCGWLKEGVISVFPLFFEWFFGMTLLKGCLRVCWLKLEFFKIKLFAKNLIAHLCEVWV